MGIKQKEAFPMPKIRRNFGHWEKKTGILPKGTHFGGLKGGGWGGEAGAEWAGYPRTGGS